MTVSQRPEPNNITTSPNTNSQLQKSNEVVHPTKQPAQIETFITVHYSSDKMSDIFTKHMFLVNHATEKKTFTFWLYIYIFFYL